MGLENLLLESLCKAAFAPQQMLTWNGSQQIVQEVPSPLVSALASMAQQEWRENGELRQLVRIEVMKPENVAAIAAEISKVVGRINVREKYGYAPAQIDVPEWIKEALTTSLTEWLGTDEAAGLVPQMLERGTIKITVERSEK